MKEEWKDIKGYTINEIKEKTKLSRDFISSVIKLFKK